MLPGIRLPEGETAPMSLRRCDRNQFCATIEGLDAEFSTVIEILLGESIVTCNAAPFSVIPLSVAEFPLIEYAPVCAGKMSSPFGPLVANVALTFPLPSNESDATISMLLKFAGSVVAPA